ncbi:MAG: hypothetical protein ACRD3K_01900 [Edaphobacter sp.]
MVNCLDAMTRAGRGSAHKKIYILYICLKVKLGLKTAGQVGLDLHGQVDFDMVVEQGEFERTYGQRLLIEDLDEAH